jgi:hypothetical protein
MIEWNFEGHLATILLCTGAAVGANQCIRKILKNLKKAYSWLSMLIAC